MKIMEVQERTPMLIEQLLAVWEDSVRATHLFLSDEEIRSIKPYVPQAIEGVARLYMATEAGQPWRLWEQKRVVGNAFHCVCGTRKRIGKTIVGTG